MDILHSYGRLSQKSAKSCELVGISWAQIDHVITTRRQGRLNWVTLKPINFTV